jgi:hypothetical protein
MTEPCTEKETIGILKAYQEDIRGDVKDIKVALLGDGKQVKGLATRVAIHSKYFKLLAAFIAILAAAKALWAWIGS